MDRSYPVLANASLDCRYFCSANCRRSSRFSASNCSTDIGLSSFNSPCPPRSSFPLTKTSSLRQRCPSARPTHWLHGTVLEHRILRLVPKDQRSGVTPVQCMAAGALTLYTASRSPLGTADCICIFRILLGGCQASRGGRGAHLVGRGFEGLEEKDSRKTSPRCKSHDLYLSNLLSPESFRVSTRTTFIAHDSSPTGPASCQQSLKLQFT